MLKKDKDILQSSGLKDTMRLLNRIEKSQEVEVANEVIALLGGRSTDEHNRAETLKGF